MDTQAPAAPLLHVIPGGARAGGEPVTVGVPWPLGALPPSSEQPGGGPALAVRGDPARQVQARVVDRWPDGSARWTLVDLQTSRPAAADGERLALERSADAVRAGARARPGPEVTATTREGRPGVVDAIELATGAATIELAVGPGFALRALRGPGGEAARVRLDLRAAGGAPLALHADALDLEEAGPLRAAARATGSARGEGGVEVRIDARIEAFAGSPAARVTVTLWNPRRARHAGGIWELGDPGSVLLGEVVLRLDLPEGGPAGASAGAAAGPSQAETRARLSIAPDAPFAPVELPLEVHQASSGGEQWRSPVHVDASGEVRLAYRGYRLRAGGAAAGDGLRATPALVLERGPLGLGVAMERFWEQFPKAVAADERGLALGLWPAGPAPHELQGGERKAHVVTIAAGDSAAVEEALAWARAPSLARAEPAWYEASGALPLFTLSHASDPTHAALVSAAVEGPASFFAKREAIDEYGWRHFGDVWADHEGAYHEDGDGPRVSHYNNQYDAVHALALAWLRTGDRRFWDLCRDLAEHVVDIDIYWTDEDKASYNHGLFWHTAHYVDAGRSTHRTYPSHPRAGSGGPSNEHCYTSGLVLYHVLTGSPRARAAALAQADWVLAMEDGGRTPFRWLAGGPTGSSSSTASLDYHGPGRGAGNAIRALLDAHALTREDRYLARAEELIRRCIHPEDDHAALRLLDGERRWSYTVFLEVLGRYLERRLATRRAGLPDPAPLDAAYAYARASLLHYARFVAEHERPWLDHPERLEYPTETWAAQELRKAEALALGRLYATDPAERARFAERERFFYRKALDALAARPGRTFTRPLVIALGVGYAHAYAEAHPEATRPRPPAEPATWPPRAPFEPQRIRALRRAKRIALGLAALAATGVAALIRWAALALAQG